VGNSRKPQVRFTPTNPLQRLQESDQVVLVLLREVEIEARIVEIDRRLPNILNPIIPFESFHDPAIAANHFITLVAPEHGGHCAFISRSGVQGDSGLNLAWSSFV
jgi:hypothetical protein